jgi:hypothetical protein
MKEETMKFAALAIPLLALSISAAAQAETGQTVGEADCEALWKKANPAMAEKVPESAMKDYFTDVKAVNPDGDGTIEADEFKKACSGGMIKSGMAANSANTPKTEAGETSDRTPEAATPTPSSQKDSSGGDTSDRTPKE